MGSVIRIFGYSAIFTGNNTCDIINTCESPIYIVIDGSNTTSEAVILGGAKNISYYDRFFVLPGAALHLSNVRSGEIAYVIVMQKDGLMSVSNNALLSDIQKVIDDLSSGGSIDEVDIPRGSIPSQIDAVASLNNSPAQKQFLAITSKYYPYKIDKLKKAFAVIGDAVSDEHGQVVIDANGFTEGVMLLCWDVWGEGWAANSFYNVGDILHPPVSKYPELGCVYKCIASGLGGVGEPVWWKYSHGGSIGMIGYATFEAIPYLAPQVQGPITPYTQEQLENGNLKINGAEYLRGSPVMFGDVHVYPYIHGSETVYRRVDTGLPFIPIITAYSE